jgi:predicted kinase
MEVAVARAARRSMAATDMSDADESVVRAMAVTEEAWPSATTIDTNAAPDAGISAAVAAVERAR